MNDKYLRKRGISASPEYADAPHSNTRTSGVTGVSYKGEGKGNNTYNMEII